MGFFASSRTHLSWVHVVQEANKKKGEMGSGYLRMNRAKKKSGCLYKRHPQPQLFFLILHSSLLSFFFPPLHHILTLRYKTKPHKMMLKSLLASSLVALVATLSTVSAGRAGQTGALISAKEYCIFLPPKYGGNIAESEDVAIAFCNKAIATAPKAKILPKGFIKSVHLVRNTQKGWVQITGRIDRTKYGLSKKDGGGQYDIKAPRGASYADYKYFVQLIEPDSDIYCLRVCKNKADCPTHRSTYGCRGVLGAGDYS